MSGITIDPETMRTVAAKAILEGISTEARDLIVEQAVQSLITPPKDQYGRSRESETPLQMAFDQALRKVAVDVCDDLVANDAAVRARVETIVAEQVATILSEDNSSIAETARRAMSDALSNFTVNRGW